VILTRISLKWQIKFAGGKLPVKRFTIALCAVALLLMFAATSLADDTVWIASSGQGKKYHYEICQTLRGGKKAIPITEAKAIGYTGCKVCNR
jgi:uncharacterized membrane protein YfbV (UPF0208 family)